MAVLNGLMELLFPEVLLAPHGPPGGTSSPVVGTPVRGGGIEVVASNRMNYVWPVYGKLDLAWRSCLIRPTSMV